MLAPLFQLSQQLDGLLGMLCVDVAPTDGASIQQTLKLLEEKLKSVGKQNIAEIYKKKLLKRGRCLGQFPFWGFFCYTKSVFLQSVYILSPALLLGRLSLTLTFVT